MFNYFTHLTNFKFFGSSTYSHVHIQSHDTCGQHEAGDWIWTCEHVEDPKNLKFVRYFCFYSASTKTSFGFCSCSEPLQLKFGEKKLSREIQIAQPPIQLQGCLRLQMKDICHIYNFVERLKCKFSCIVGVKVAQS